MVDGFMVTVRQGVERGQCEVDLIVGGLKGQEVPQPGDGVLNIAGAGHELGLAQLEGQALWIHFAGIVEHLPRLTVAARVLIVEFLVVHQLH